MLIAIPICQARVSPVFDTASKLLLVRRQRGRETERKEVVLGVLAAETLVRSIVELHVEVLLCAAISGPLRMALEGAGIRVEPHLCGEVEPLLAAYVAGTCRRSEFRMPGCWDGHHAGTRARLGAGVCTERARRTGGLQ